MTSASGKSTANSEIVLAAKTALARAVVRRSRELHQTQAAAARSIGIDAAQMSRLVKGKYKDYSLNWLLDSADRLGVTVTITVE